MAKPLLGLAMMMRDEESVLPHSLGSVLELVDTWTIVDTGSTDSSVLITEALMKKIPGRLLKREWRNFGENYTELLELARGTAQWLLIVDADQRVEFHPDLKQWLSAYDDDALDAFMVETEEAGTTWRLPLLLRGDRDWRMVGTTHEYLALEGKRTRPFYGESLTLHNLRPGGGVDPIARLQENARLLESEADRGDPRSTFYLAETLRELGETKFAIDLYERRAKMGSFEEEAWFAEYRAAELRKDPEALIAAWRRRPSRHEPITALARLVASQPNDDVLFKQPLTGGK